MPARLMPRLCGSAVSDLAGWVAPAGARVFTPGFVGMLPIRVNISGASAAREAAPRLGCEGDIVNPAVEKRFRTVCNRALAM